MMVPVAAEGLQPPGTVLVVEDDHDVRVAVRNTLEDEGYRVLSVTDGRHALELIEHSAPPDLILLDLMLPVMDGWEFVERVRADARWSAIPIVAMSAYDRQPPEGIVAFLKKPVRLEALTHLAERFCRRW